MDSDPDEYILALRARAGDRNALAELVERFRLPLFMLAYRLLGNYDDAQDAVAAALLQACRHVTGLREPGGMGAWLRSIVRNEARRLHRQAGEPAFPLEEAEGEAEGPGISLLRFDVESAFRRMPGPHARALRMFYLDGLPVEEIARRTGCSQGTVKSWLHRGRRQLAVEMKEYAPMTPAPDAPRPRAALIHTHLEPTLVRKITALLRSGGYQTRVLSGGDPGTLLPSLERYHLLVLDEWLGGRSALELLMHLRTGLEARETPICQLCQDPSVFTVGAYYSAGVDRLINKAQPEELVRLAEPFEERFASRFRMFTERARRVIFFAQEEAARCDDTNVGAEHLLLGLIREEDSLAGRILQRLGISIPDLRASIVVQIPRGAGAEGPMQFTHGARRVIDLAHEEARSLQHNYLGTEHLLLGLIREGDGPAGRVLLQATCSVEHTRQAFREIAAEEKR